MTEWCGWPVVEESTGWEAAQQILTDAELSDGLPLVPPTQRRLEAMVAGIADRTESRGMLPPMFGDLTPEAVAYQCVIAGALPGRAAGRAGRGRGDPRTRLQPARHRHDHRHRLRGALRARPDRAHSSASMPAPTASAPATAPMPASAARCSSCIRNIGGARSDTGDMATMGQPGKYTLLLRRTERRPLPHPDRAPRPRQRRERHHGDGHLRHGRGAAGRRRRRHARGDPVADRRRRCAPPSSCPGMSRKNERGEQVFLLPLEMAREDRPPRRLGSRRACSATCSTKARASPARPKPSIPS